MVENGQIPQKMKIGSVFYEIDKTLKTQQDQIQNLTKELHDVKEDLKKVQPK
ncbi:MAG: hypothetical protein ACRDFB_08220 [Rhabdochlamydiaceae bacterium]